MLHPELQPILDEMNAAPGPAAHELPINEARAAHVAETAWLCGDGEPVAEVRNVAAPGPGGEIPVRIYVPERPDGVVAYIHGGGWTMGTLDGYDAALTRLANAAGATVASIDYRLAPEHRFPAAVDDCLAAIRWLAAEFPDDWYAVAGDSAGGNLAAVAARRLRDAVPLRLQVLIYPVIDAAVNTPSYREFSDGHGLSAASMRRFWNLYLDGADGNHPDASPLRASDLAGVAPAFVLTAEVDVLRDEGEAYATALREAGVPVELLRWPGAIHGFWRWQAATSVAREAVEAVAERIRAAAPA
ncbi:MAG TPA: alpha/beta hydrolase [Solirubrobacteraceae bacterium]|nr:alpha/beta hydrolase [Solirubrobacteraceae bacterium]